MVPTDRKYTREHDWVLIEDGVATLGITDHAQSELGDIVYVELPEVDSEINLGESYTTVESVFFVKRLYRADGSDVELTRYPGWVAGAPSTAPLPAPSSKSTKSWTHSPSFLTRMLSVSSSQRSKLPKSTKQACSPQKNTKSCLKKLNQPVPVAALPKPVLFGTVPR